MKKEEFDKYSDIYSRIKNKMDNIQLSKRGKLSNNDKAFLENVNNLLEEEKAKSIEELDKKLLSQYICSSLPYGLVVTWSNEEVCEEWFTLESITSEKYGINKEYTQWKAGGLDIGELIPYLRPLSSMTEEELNELLSLPVTVNFYLFEGKLSFSVNHEGWEQVEIPVEEVAIITNWLISYHFDYRGFIEKGLALEAPGDMYK